MADAPASGRPRKARRLTPPAPAALPFAWLVTGWGAVGLAWQLATGGNPWIVAWLPGVGVLLLLRVLLKRRRTRDFSQAQLETQPRPVTTGRPFTVRIRLPAAGALGAGLVMRVVQRRVEHTSSMPDSQLEWEQAHPVRVQPLAEGGQQVEASFLLPADAPPTGAYRDELHVQWLVQLIDAQGLARLSVALPVQADPSGAVAPALGEGLFEEKPLDELPEGRLRIATPWFEAEDAGGVTWRFQRRRLRVLGSAAGLGALALLVLLHGRSPVADGLWRLRGDDLPLLIALAILLPLAVHALSLRWWLRVDDDGLAVDRSSWLWPRRQSLGVQSLEQVTRMTVGLSGRGGGDRAHYRLVAGPAGGVRHWLTPTLRGPGLAQVLARRLRAAFDHRGSRFSPGWRRAPRPPWPWMAAGALWGIWIALLAAAWTRLG
ncbi:MAG: hypothetical protein JNJ71_20980 [Rubrivivax sp.]|nr:hypothetical protein [Rubrivivax sp.]